MIIQFLQLGEDKSPKKQGDVPSTKMEREFYDLILTLPPTLPNAIFE